MIGKYGVTLHRRITDHIFDSFSDNRMNRIWLVVLVMLACGCSGQERLRVCVSEEVVQSSYLGNGVEWDPYDEAPSWGAEVSDSDWETLFTRMDFLRPGFIRCMVGGQNLYYDRGTYDRERNAASLLKLLSFCQDRGIEVIYGEFNPPDRSLKADDAWVKMSVDYLDWLVREKGFDCIRHFIIFNEPDGDWATPEGDYGFWKSMMERFHAEMARHPGLLEKVSLAGPDVVIEYRNPASAYDAPAGSRRPRLTWTPWSACMTSTPIPGSIRSGAALSPTCSGTSVSRKGSGWSWARLATNTGGKKMRRCRRRTTAARRLPLTPRERTARCCAATFSMDWTSPSWPWT